MSGRDPAGYLAIVGEQLRQTALEYKTEAKPDDPWDAGVVFGFVCALDLMWDHLELFGLTPEDLTWKDFVPERDLLGGHPTSRNPDGFAKPED